MYHRVLRRAIPAAAMLLGAGAIAASSSYAAPGVVVPGGEIDYNIASVVLSGFPTGTAEPVTVTRDGVAIATTTVTTDGLGNAALNTPGILPPEVLSCWTGFTPDILPGDTIIIGAAGAGGLVVPNMSVDRPVQSGSDIFLHGTAADPISGAPLAQVDGALFNKLGRFQGIGSKGGQFLSAVFDGGFISYDAAGSTHWTARWNALSPANLNTANGSVAESSTVPIAGAAGAVFTIAFDNPGTPGPTAGCAAPLGRDAVTGTSAATINAANAATPVTITGTADPNVKSVVLTLGGVAVPATMAGASWSATVPASSLPEGKLLASAAYTSAAGTYHGETTTIVKDTIAPAAPTATVPAGAYTSAQTVGLNASDGTVRYTIDGSDPTANSPKYGDAIHVNSSGTIKAVAVDAAGNVSSIAQFDYAINKPAPVVQQPIVVPQPKAPTLKLDALTITSSLRLSSAHRHGIHMVVFAPDGAKVVRIKVTRNGRTIDTVMRRVTGDGVLTVVMPRSKHARHALKRGTYKVLVTPGSSASKLGATTSRTVRIR
jgi:hypothetical protein